MDNSNNFLENWSEFDATSNLNQRINGVTKDLILDEVKLWEEQLKMLRPVDYQSIKTEIDEWIIEIPRKNLNYDNISMTYARLVSYKHRTSQLMALVKSWDDTCEAAIDFLKDLCHSAFTGTAADKKSNATYVIQPFVHLKNQTARVLNYLDKMDRSVVFCSQQLDLLLKERQSQSKLNYKLGHSGENSLTESAMPKEVIEEDGDVFR